MARNCSDRGYSNAHDIRNAYMVNSSYQRKRGYADEDIYEDLIDKTLLEEDTDMPLTDIAESYINLKAEMEGLSWEREKENSM